VSVLIVDDEPPLADTLATILQMAGYAAVAVYSAAAAVEMAEVAPPDLLITDFSMPGMNGIELAVRLCASIPACEIFLISAADPAEVIEQIRLSGHAFRFISKPIHPGQLLSEVARCKAAYPEDLLAG
jgi:CheY-like chemotaxis protein